MVPLVEKHGLNALYCYGELRLQLIQNQTSLFSLKGKIFF